jgi:hypothetical protein
MQRIGDMEISQDLRHEQREWLMERLGWLVMALLLAAALAGLLGSGPVSTATTGAAGEPLRIEYDRFGHYQSPTTLKLHLAPRAVQGTRVRLWIARDYMQNLEVETIQPQPEHTQVSAERITYTFNAPASSEPTTIIYRVQPNTFGTFEAHIGLEDRPPVRFSQFIYP